METEEGNVKSMVDVPFEEALKTAEAELRAAMDDVVPNTYVNFNLPSTSQPVRVWGGNLPLKDSIVPHYFPTVGHTIHTHVRTRQCVCAEDLYRVFEHLRAHPTRHTRIVVTNVYASPLWECTEDPTSPSTHTVESTLKYLYKEESSTSASPTSTHTRHRVKTIELTPVFRANIPQFEVLEEKVEIPEFDPVIEKPIVLWFASGESIEILEQDIHIQLARFGAWDTQYKLDLTVERAAIFKLTIPWEDREKARRILKASTLAIGTHHHLLLNSIRTIKNHSLEDVRDNGNIQNVPSIVRESQKCPGPYPWEGHQPAEEGRAGEG